jgi:peptidoglycan/xylan/chitin deacetylase (PgdA/CDA1 family)
MRVRRVAVRALVTAVRGVSRALPDFALAALYHRATAGLGVAICCHRVGRANRPFDACKEMAADPRALDKLLELVTAHGRAAATPPLTMTFDDGYADGISYVAQRASRYKNVDWLIFVCPEKTSRRVGYRWDHYELLQRRQHGKLRAGLTDFLTHELDIDAENDREVLHEAAARPEFELASVADLQRLAALPNVRLGCHSNSHLPLSRLSEEDAKRELWRSTLAFEELFAERLKDFAFPFGGPGVHFDEVHADYLRQLRAPVMWSTEGRPHWPGERRPGRLLPRFALPGEWGGKAMVLWIALQALRFRWTTQPEPGRLETRARRAKTAATLARGSDAQHAAPRQASGPPSHS